MSAEKLSDSQISNIKRLLVIQLDPLDPSDMVEEAISALQHCRPDLSLIWLKVREDDGFTVSYTIAGDIPLAVHDNNPQATIQWIQDQRMDAAIVFAERGRSPYTWAYRCYLAGVPIRVGQSQEFGGQVLSHCISSADPDVSNPYLRLLQTCGLLEVDVGVTLVGSAHPT